MDADEKKNLEASLKLEVTNRLADAAQNLLPFVEYVHITGRVAFDIDGAETIVLHVNTMAVPLPLNYDLPKVIVPKSGDNVSTLEASAEPEKKVEDPANDEAQKPLKMRIKKSKRSVSSKQENVQPFEKAEEIISTEQEEKMIIDEIKNEVETIEDIYAGGVVGNCDTDEFTQVTEKSVDTCTIKSEPVDSKEEEEASNFINDQDDQDFEESGSNSDDEWEPPATKKVSEESGSNSDDEWEPPTTKKVTKKKIILPGSKSAAKSNTKQKVHKCTSCDNFKTVHMSKLKEHYKQKHDMTEMPFKCTSPGCELSFITQNSRDKHVKADHQKVKCTICDKEIANFKALKGHYKEKHPDSMVEMCMKCQVVFNSKQEFTKHLCCSKHTHTCSICDKMFRTMGLLYRHKEDVHPNETLSCKICGKKMQSVKALNVHIKRHDKTRERALCKICGKTFSSQSTLSHHKRGVHDKDNHYQCDECGQEFSFHHSLKLHKLHHKGERPFKCHIPSCGKSYLTSNHLKMHIEAKHSAIKKYTCPVCDKSFSYDNSLKMHMMIHTNERHYICCICSRGFVSKSALKQHEASHTEERAFQCKYCQKMYKTPHLLRAHERRHTADGSRYMCDICGHTFMYKSNLEAHAVVHKDGKNYQCPKCDKQFKTYSTLYSHAKVHQLEKPFCCDQCGKSFKTKECLKAHEARHSGLKPFSCSLCKSCFPDKGGLSKHQKTVHASRPRFACPVCGKKCNRMDNLRVHMKTHNNPALLDMTADQLQITGVAGADDMDEAAAAAAAAGDGLLDVELLPPPPATRGRKKLSQQNGENPTAEKTEDLNTISVLQANDSGINISFPHESNSAGNMAAAAASDKTYQTLQVSDLTSSFHPTTMVSNVNLQQHHHHHHDQGPNVMLGTYTDLSHVSAGGFMYPSMASTLLLAANQNPPPGSQVNSSGANFTGFN